MKEDKRIQISSIEQFPKFEIFDAILLVSTVQKVEEHYLIIIYILKRDTRVSYGGRDFVIQVVQMQRPWSKQG